MELEKLVAEMSTPILDLSKAVMTLRLSDHSNSMAIGQLLKAHPDVEETVCNNVEAFSKDLEAKMQKAKLFEPEPESSGAVSDPGEGG
jgi:hypothetical protein